MRYQLGASVRDTLPDLNSCTARTLVKNVGLSPAIARDIIRFKRTKGGRYDHIGELWQLEKMTLPLFDFISSMYTVYNLPKPRNKHNKAKTVKVKSVKGQLSVSKQGSKRTRASRKTKDEVISQDKLCLPAGSGLFYPSEITMNPVAVTTSPSGNALMVTYRAVNTESKIFVKSSGNVPQLNADTGTPKESKVRPSDGQVTMASSHPHHGDRGPEDDVLTVAHVKYAEASQNKPSRLKSIEKWILDVNEAGPSRADDKGAIHKAEKSSNRGSKALTKKSKSSRKDGLPSKSDTEEKNERESNSKRNRLQDKPDEVTEQFKKDEYLEEYLHLLPAKESEKSKRLKTSDVQEDSQRKSETGGGKKSTSDRRATAEDQAGIPGTSEVKTEPRHADLPEKRSSRFAVAKQRSVEKVSLRRSESVHQRQDKGRDQIKDHPTTSNGQTGGGGKGEHPRRDRKDSHPSDDKHHRAHDKQHRSHEKHHRSHDKHHRSHDRHHRSHDKNDKAPKSKDSSCSIM